MSSPNKDMCTAISKTTFGPADSKDARTVWAKLVDGLRQSVGLKPVYLAERWAVARVRSEEIDNDAKLLQAKAEYEVAIATASQITLQAEGQYAKDMAIAKWMESNTGDHRVPDGVKELLQAPEMSLVDALAKLDSLVQQVRSCGGLVEVRIEGDGQQSGA